MRRIRFGATFGTLCQRVRYGGRKGRRARARIRAINAYVLAAVRGKRDLRAAIWHALGWGPT